MLNDKPAVFLKNDGFTLVETMVAIMILVIGIFSLYAMQTTAIRGNAQAIALTGASNWAADRIEQVLGMPWDDAESRTNGIDDDHDGTVDETDEGNMALLDRDGDGIGGLDDIMAATADGSAVSPDGRYTLFWNVSGSLMPYPASPAESTVKAVRVHVLRNDYGIQKQVTLNYFKQKDF